VKSGLLILVLAKQSVRLKSEKASMTTHGRSRKAYHCCSKYYTTLWKCLQLLLLLEELGIVRSSNKNKKI